MSGEIGHAMPLRKSRRLSSKSLISLKRGTRAEVRRFGRKPLIFLGGRAAAEVPPIIPLSACARANAARSRVQDFVR
jgi:hypothetical protein